MNQKYKWPTWTWLGFNWKIYYMNSSRYHIHGTETANTKWPIWSFRSRDAISGVRLTDKSFLSRDRSDNLTATAIAILPRNIIEVLCIIIKKSQCWSLAPYCSMSLRYEEGRLLGDYDNVPHYWGSLNGERGERVLHERTKLFAIYGVTNDRCIVSLLFKIS